jgi:hypothetical protein
MLELFPCDGRLRLMIPHKNMTFDGSMFRGTTAIVLVTSLLLMPFLSLRSAVCSSKTKSCCKTADTKDCRERSMQAISARSGNCCPVMQGKTDRTVDQIQPELKQTKIANTVSFSGPALSHVFQINLRAHYFYESKINSPPRSSLDRMAFLQTFLI